MAQLSGIRLSNFSKFDAFNRALKLNVRSVCARTNAFVTGTTTLKTICLDTSTEEEYGALAPRLLILTIIKSDNSQEGQKSSVKSQE